MGGKALKNVSTRRLAAAEYHALVPAVLAQVAAIVGAERALAALDAYRTKTDFGDMDLLVQAEDLPADYREQLAAEFHSREVVRTKNSSVTSFEREGFQIDVIEIPNESFEFAKAYLSFNDLGNLLGRVARPMGLKLGLAGLFYPLKNAQNTVVDVLVTRDFAQALDTLRFDPRRFASGFETMQEIFEFTSSSPLFSPALFMPDERNAKARQRNAKRKTYSAFVQWLREGGGPTQQPAEPAFCEMPADGSSWLQALREKFPEFAIAFDIASAAPPADTRALEAKLLFNGKLVSEITGLRGKELGDLMRDMHAQHATREAFNDWVLAAGAAGIQRCVEELARVRSEDSTYTNKCCASQGA